jgi:tetratricopeptide (TPR) repeat protein
MAIRTASPQRNSVMNSNTDESVELCANCGITGGDDVKLRLCTACKLVKYCSVACQKNHRPQHKKACKKRAAEIREVLLFTQNEVSYLGECPLCCLPIPLDLSKSVVNSCCCKRICFGCCFANKKREFEQGLEERCPFCREPVPETDEEMNQNHMKRAKANDPIALCELGVKCHHEGDYEGAFQYTTKAAALGDMDAHYNLSNAYQVGEGVERDPKTEVYHLEEAAIGGHDFARYNLANHEGRNGNVQKAVKHYIIAAKLGNDDALEAVKINFRRGFVNKEDYEAALRGHQAAIDATKSEQREEAYKARQEGII